MSTKYFTGLPTSESAPKAPTSSTPSYPSSGPTSPLPSDQPVFTGLPTSESKPRSRSKPRSKPSTTPPSPSSGPTSPTYFTGLPTSESAPPPSSSTAPITSTKPDFTTRTTQSVDPSVQAIISERSSSSASPATQSRPVTVTPSVSKRVAGSSSDVVEITKYAPSMFHKGETKSSYEGFSYIEPDPYTTNWFSPDRDVSDGRTFRETVPNVFGVLGSKIEQVGERWTSKDSPFLKRTAGHTLISAGSLISLPSISEAIITNPPTRSDIMLGLQRARADNTPLDPASLPIRIGEVFLGDVAAARIGKGFRNLKFDTELRINALEDATRPSTWIDPRYDVVVQSDPGVRWLGGEYGGRLVPANRLIRVSPDEFQTQLIPDPQRAVNFDKTLGLAELPKPSSIKSTSDLINPQTLFRTETKPLMSVDVSSARPTITQTTFVPLPENPWTSQGVSVVSKDSPFALAIERNGQLRITELPTTGPGPASTSKPSRTLLTSTRGELSPPTSIFDDLADKSVEWIEKSRDPIRKATESTLSIVQQRVTPELRLPVRGVLTQLSATRQDIYQPLKLDTKILPISEQRIYPQRIETLTATKELLKTDALLDVDTLTDVLTKTKTKTLTKTWQEGKLFPDSVLVQETALKTIPVQDLISRSRLKGATNKIPKTPLRPPFFIPRPRIRSIYQPLNNQTFVSEVKSKGVFLRTGVPTSFEDAWSSGLRGIRDTASASFRIIDTRTGQAVRPSTGRFTKDLRLSKVDPSVVVQRRGFRISSAGEKRDITYKGIFASKNKKRRFNLWE